MDTTNFSLPEQLVEFVQARVTEGGYDNVNEYISDLVRADQKKQAWAMLEAEVAKGIDSGPAEPMTAQNWAELRGRISQRAEQPH